MSRLIALKEISSRIGLDKSNTRKWLIAQGFTFVRTRDIESRQLINALTEEDAERAIELRENQGFADREGNLPAASNGYFYVVRLMPDLAPNRIKFGFADYIQSRMSAHRTTCPKLEIVQTWPCLRAYESTAIAVAVNGGSTLYGGEVYDVESVDEVVNRLDRLFEMLPKPI